MRDRMSFCKSLHICLKTRISGNDFIDSISIAVICTTYAIVLTYARERRICRCYDWQTLIDKLKDFSGCAEFVVEILLVVVHNTDMAKRKQRFQLVLIQHF